MINMIYTNGVDHKGEHNHKGERKEYVTRNNKERQTGNDNGRDT